MKDWNTTPLVVMLAILVFVPLIAEEYFVGARVDDFHGASAHSRREQLEQARLNELRRREEDELNRKRLRDAMFAWYECDPRATCKSVDFNMDGSHERLTLEKLPGLDETWLTVTAANDKRVLLRLPFNDDAGDLRTRVGVVTQKEESHLLVYDQVSYTQPLELVYRYDGRRMEVVSGAEFKIAAPNYFVPDGHFTIHDGGEIEGIRDTALLKLCSYYFILTVLVAVFIYRRQGTANGGNVHLSLKGHP